MINREQLIARKYRVGSSDSPAIVGVDPYQSIADIYISKTEDLEQIVDKEAIEIGTEHERPLLAWAARELGINIQLDVHRDSPDGILSSNLDALSLSNKRVALEAKTTSNSKDYGEPGSDQVPDRVIVQCQHHCYVNELDLVYIPVLMARYDRLKREIYVVKRNEDLIKSIVTADHFFWNEHVVPHIPPEGMLPSIDVLSRIIRNPGEITIINRDALSRYEFAKEISERAKELEVKTRTELLALSGNAEILDFNDPDSVYSYRQQERRDVDTQKLKLLYPNIYDELVKIKEYRVLRKIKRPRELPIGGSQLLLEE